MAKDERKARARVMDPLLRVGKNGLSESFLQELSLLVKKRGLVKVRFLKSFSDEHDVKEESRRAAQAISAELLDVTGSTAVFARQ